VHKTVAPNMVSYRGTAAISPGLKHCLKGPLLVAVPNNFVKFTFIKTTVKVVPILQPVRCLVKTRLKGTNTSHPLGFFLPWLK